MQNKTNHAWQKTAWVLVGINLILLFWLEGGMRLFGVDINAGHEPQRLEMQVQPQAILPAASVASEVASQSESASSSESEKADSPKAEPASSKEASH